MGENAITLENIVKSYGNHQVLKGVNLNIKKGQIYGLIGKNGAGKSTIFKVILGLTEYTSGRLIIGDENTPLDEGRKKIGFLVGNNFFPNLTGKANLRYYADLKGVKHAKSEVDRVLKIVGLEGVKTKVSGYSLGMKQRLGIANAILGNPEILILDEPTNGLDPQGIADIRHLIQALNSEYNMTVIVSSHILGELQHTAHRFAILNDGIIVRDLSEDDLKDNSDKISIKVNDLERTMELLKEAGIEATVEEKTQKSLEDMYFALVGGSK